MGKLTMDLAFGTSVQQKAIQLKEEGKDPNQIANTLYKADKKGANYGIGIVLNGHGKALISSKTLLDYSRQELSESNDGSYKNSLPLMAELKEATLRWQRIPESYWGRFKLVIPSDAGTGAVKTGVEFSLMRSPRIKTLGIEKWGWPAFKAIAKVAGLQVQEFDGNDLISGDEVLAIYQAGPMNSTGEVQPRDVIERRAKAAAKSNGSLLLDRAYSGFEFARLLGPSSYDHIMKKSFELQIKPFLDEGVPFALALSPTKAFVTFSLRPCGLLLVYSPESSNEKSIVSALNTIIRARGSSFEHPITRAFVKGFVKDLPRFEKEHEQTLKRVAEAEGSWREWVKGTRMAYLFSDRYAGLFRNARVDEDAPEKVYNEHLYPVFSQSRCRLNITGLPRDTALAQKHVGVFANYCY